MFRRVLMFAVLFAALTPAAGLAQTGGTVAGLVRDSLGGAIPGATVRVVNEATGLPRKPSVMARAAIDSTTLRRGSIASRPRSTGSSRRLVEEPSMGVKPRRLT